MNRHDIEIGKEYAFGDDPKWFSHGRYCSKVYIIDTEIDKNSLPNFGGRYLKIHRPIAAARYNDIMETWDPILISVRNIYGTWEEYLKNEQETAEQQDREKQSIARRKAKIPAVREALKKRHIDPSNVHLDPYKEYVSLPFDNLVFLLGIKDELPPAPDPYYAVRPERSVECFERGAELVRRIIKMWDIHDLIPLSVYDRNQIINQNIENLLKEFDLTVPEWHYWAEIARGKVENT